MSWVRPWSLPKRRDLPISLTRFTLSTFTPNMSSTAALMDGLVESRRTRNEYVFAFCIASEVFSVMCGAGSTEISFSWLGAFFGASLMSTTFALLAAAVAFSLFGAFGAFTAFSAFSAFGAASFLAALTADAPR